MLFMPKPCLLFLLARPLAVVAADGSASAFPLERRLTSSPEDHILTNVNAWSPDSRWLAYDTRQGPDFNGTRIEQVDATSGQVQRLYDSRDGAHCGVVTYHPTEPRVVFILGPENPTPDWQYAFSRRRGVIVNAAQPGFARPLDAANYAPPFTPGALRGGSHVHVFSPDGECVSFTYDDEVLTRRGNARGAPAGGSQINQRNVGVAVPRPVRVARSHARNQDGDYFSVLVTRTVNQPRPGSDEISRACEEGWVGKAGYLRTDGTRQARALAFLGTVTADNGSQHAEVFIADLPNDLTHAGVEPLEGTEITRPAPPRGVTQRRLTFTDKRASPGVALAPRHWLRASPEGDLIAFLMKDDAGVVQLWLVSPTGGPLRQLSHHAWSVASAFTWSPDGRWIAHVMDNSVFVTDTVTGAARRLTARSQDAESPLTLACVFSPDGRRIAYLRRVDGHSQIFTVDFPSGI